MREGEGDEEERDGESARCKGGDTLASLQGRPSTISRWKRRALAAREENSNLAGGVSERARAREGESEGEETGRRESTQGCPVSPAAAPPPPAPSTGAGAPSAAAARTRGGSSTPATVHAVAGPHCPLSTSIYIIYINCGRLRTWSLKQIRDAFTKKCSVCKCGGTRTLPTVDAVAAAHLPPYTLPIQHTPAVVSHLPPPGGGKRERKLV